MFAVVAACIDDDGAPTGNWEGVGLCPWKPGGQVQPLAQASEACSDMVGRY